MASLGHIAVGLAAGRAFVGPQQAWGKAALAFSLVSIWPDADYVGFSLGVHYEDPFGHRGATHSMPVAIAVGLASIAFAHVRHLPLRRTWLFTTAVALSHGLLDTMTFGGGLGCALLWPFSNTRFWAPWRFIPVAPMGLHFLSARGFGVMEVELFMFCPFWLYALWPRRAPPLAPAP